MKLLIAEDDRSLAELISVTVPDDWQVLRATDGIQALSLARVHEPDAIVLDHDMPVLNGVEVCRLLASESWRTACTVVALTGVRDLEVRREMTRAGVDAFLEKPFSPVQLLDLLDVWDRHGA